MGLKDMMKSFLFETVEPDEEEEDDVTPEEQETSKPVRTVKPPVQTHTVSQTTAPVTQTISTPTPTQIDQQTNQFLASSQSANSQSTFFSQVGSVMGLDEAKKEEPKPAKKTTVKRAAASTQPGVRRRELKQTLNYQAVLSPIFGNLPDDQKDTSAIHDAINLPEPDDNLDMVRIISPMTGLTPKPKKRTSQEVIRRSAAPKAPADPTEAEKADALRSARSQAPAKEDEPAAPAQPAPAKKPGASRSRISDGLLEAAKEQVVQEAQPKKTMDLAAYLSRPAGHDTSKDDQKDGSSK